MDPEKTVDAAPDAELGLHGGVRGHEVEIPPDEALRENWLKTGEHREAKPKEPTETASKQSEGEKAIAALSHEERERWMLTGEMPKKPAATEKPAEKKAEPEPEKPGESATEGEPKHILSRVAVLGEPIDNVKHQEAVNSYADRFSKDYAGSGVPREEVESVLASAKTIQPSLPQRLITFMEAGYPHLQHPFHFVRKFYTDPELRSRILAEDARANAKGILRIMAKVDGEIASDIALRAAPPPKRVTSAPAPGTRGAGGGKRIAPIDATVAALKNGDFEAYMNAENEKQERAFRRGERY